MRVAITATAPNAVFPSAKSASITRIMETLIRGLQEAGHEPLLLAPASSKIDCELIPICEKPIHLLEDENFRLTRQGQERILDALRRILHRIDIIHAHGLDLPNFFHSSGLLSAIDFPNVTTCHSSIDLTNIDYFERCTNNIISVSHNQQEACPSLRFIRNVYHGLDPNPFPFVAAPEDYLCFLGRLDEAKQPHLAIQLAIKLGMKLKIAGPIMLYFEKDYLEKKCFPYFNHPLIEYLGELGMDEKIEMLSRAKCNLHPTGFREPFGLTIIEAAYCGTPTLAIRRGSLPELIEDKHTGILVEDFAEGYHKIYRCFDLERRYISQRARALFDYRVMTQEYLLAYEDVINLFRR
jgi:glycosyltransferase involved in cell wall biosynthesis